VLAKYWPWWPIDVVNWALRAVRRLLTSPAVIDPEARILGLMIKGVQIVATGHEGMVPVFASHWVSQACFEEATVMASIYDATMPTGCLASSVDAGG